MTTADNIPAPRLSGRIGQVIGLNVQFTHNGVAAAPFAIRRIDIYKNSELDNNKVAEIHFPDPRLGIYPLPALTDPNRPGFFQVNWLVPTDFQEGLYFDVWRFIGTDPGITALGSEDPFVPVMGSVLEINQDPLANEDDEDDDDEPFGGSGPLVITPEGDLAGPATPGEEIQDDDDDDNDDVDREFTPCEPTAEEEEPDIDDGHHLLRDESRWFKQCNKFYLFPDGWFLDDGLIIPRFAFEPLDVRFRKGEVRTLEVGLMPLPLYDYDANRIMPLIPRLVATISIETENAETLVENQPCRIGLRQGSVRSNPYVIQATLDASAFLIGTYVYRIKVGLPNGESRISEPFRFTIV